MIALRLVACAALGCATLICWAHDIWLEPNQTVVRTGETVEVSLMLGNHGNHHRDFKLASKVLPEDRKLSVIAPNKSISDITPTLIDRSMDEDEGFCTGQLKLPTTGMYCIFSTFDKVKSYGPVRDVKCAKTFVRASDKLDGIKPLGSGFGQKVNAALELVPLVDPTSLRVGSTVRVQALANGKPLSKVIMSFIPRGIILQGDIDPRYESQTDQNGIGSLKLQNAGMVLIAVHREADAPSGEKAYETINYSATLTIRVGA